MICCKEQEIFSNKYNVDATDEKENKKGENRKKARSEKI